MANLPKTVVLVFEFFFTYLNWVLTMAKNCSNTILISVIINIICFFYGLLTIFCFLVCILKT